MKPAASHETGAAPDLVVSLVTYNSDTVLRRCIESLKDALAGLDARIVVIDNASREGPPTWIREVDPTVTLVENRVNVGFGRANNQVAATTSAPYLLLVNTDAFVDPASVRRALDYMRSHPECGVLGARLVGPSGEAQFAARPFPTAWRAFLVRAGLWPLARRWMAEDRCVPPGDEPVECDWVPGCFYLVRKEVLDRVGLFDPRYFLYFEEVDHCRRVRRAGWKVVCLPTVRVVHVGGASAATEGELSRGSRQLAALQIESELLYFRKYFGLHGLLVHVFLQAAADPLRMLVNAARLRRTRHLGDAIRGTRTMLALLVATRLGTRPTR